MQENHHELKKKLQQGMQELGIQDPEKLKLLWDYLLLLQKWNQTYNLTAVRNLEDMIVQHLFDSLAIYPYLEGKDFIDVGTGAGLPGIPLSIILPEKNFTLLDSNSKKTAFLVNVKSALKLNNVNVVCTRVEAHAECYEGVLSRAFSTLAEFVEITRPLLKPEGHWYAMKGPLYQQELSAVPKAKALVKTLSIPFLNKERFLIIIKNAEAL